MHHYHSSFMLPWPGWLPLFYICYSQSENKVVFVKTFALFCSLCVCFLSVYAFKVCVCFSVWTFSAACLSLVTLSLPLYSYLHPLPPTQTYTHTHRHTHTLTTYWFHLKYPLCYLTLQRKPPKPKHCFQPLPIYINLCYLAWKHTCISYYLFFSP